MKQFQPICEFGPSIFKCNIIAYHRISQGDSEIAIMLHVGYRYLRLGVDGNFTFPLIPDFKWSILEGFYEHSKYLKSKTIS